MIPTYPTPIVILQRTDPTQPAPALDHPQPSVSGSHFPGEIVERMRECKDPISLEPSDQDEIRKYCSTHLPFLHHLVRYFVNIGAKLELGKGTMHAVGKSFWQMTLSKKIDAELLTAEMWKHFCADIPQFEIWITLSDQHDRERLNALIIYFCAAQYDLPATEKLALAEFGRLMDFVFPSDANQTLSENDTRLYQLKQKISGLNVIRTSFFLPSRLKPCEAIEMGTYKFIFGLPPNQDDFCLQLAAVDDERLGFELKAPRLAWDVLLKKVLLRPTSEQLWGRYWADLTLEGIHSQLPESKEAVIGEAYMTGMRFMPPGEAWVFYHCNAVSTLGAGKTLPFPDLLPGTPLSPMGHFLSIYHRLPVRYVLHLMGSLLPGCRRLNSQVEISWKYGTPLHLVLPFKFEETMAQIDFWLKKDRNSCLSCIDHAIRVLSPSILELPFSPPNFWKLDDLYAHLRSDERFFHAAIRFYFLLHAAGYKTFQACDAIDLPAFISYGFQTNQLEAVLTNLGQIYHKMPFFKKLMQILRDSTPDKYRQICIEQLLTCGEKEIVSLAWNSFSEAHQLPFLQHVASQLDDHAFECALQRIRRHDFSQADLAGVEVLSAYMTRLLQRGGRLSDIYLEELVEKVSTIDRSLWFNLRVKVLGALPSPEASLLGALRSTIAKTEPGIWWKNFLMVRNFIGKKDQKFRRELSAVFRDAATQSDLSSQEGYAEVHGSLMVPKLMEEADYMPLLTCEDPKTLAMAWARSKNSQTYSYLLETAARFGPSALPYAMRRVYEISSSLKPEEKCHLLSVYCSLPGLEASDRSKMMALLKSVMDGSREVRPHLVAYPGVMDLSAEFLIQGLSTGVKKLESAVWWGHFVSVLKFLQEKGIDETSSKSLAALFQAAHRRFDLTGQERCVEVYQTLARGITDVPTQRAFQFAAFVSQKRCEESDVLQLPDFIAYAAEKNQLESALEKLGLVYENSRFAPLFTQVRNKVLEARAADAVDSAELRAVCVRELLICEEPKILESIWASSKKEQTLSFLLEIAPLLGPHALAFAINRVCSHTALASEDSVRLLSAYLSRAPSEARLRSLLTARLKTNPLLNLDPSIPVEDQCRLECLEAAIGKEEPQVWWGHFLALRKTPGIDTVFQKALRRVPELKGQEHFEEVYHSIALQFFEARNEAGLLALLRLASQELAYPWFQKLIERHLDEKTVISGEILAALIGAGAPQKFERTVLMNLITYLVEQKNLAVAKEVQALCRTAVLQAAEIPPVLEYFNSGVSDGCLIDEMIHSFSSVDASELRHVLEPCVSRLEKMARKDPLWNKFAELLALMVESEGFLEDALKILERLANHAPIPCFRPQFPVSRLSVDQKLRLAQCYLVALDRLPIEITQANADWMQEQLRQEESWGGFTRLFLHLHRPAGDVENAKILEDAFWIASRLLNHPDSKLFKGFERFLGGVRTSHLNTDEWKPLITRFVDRNPAMIQYVDKQNRSFFENCRTKAPKPPKAETSRVTVAAGADKAGGTLSESLETRDVFKSPDTMREEIKNLLSQRPMTFIKFNKVVTLLDEMPEEYELWESFFEALTEVKKLQRKLGTNLLELTWFVWNHNHQLSRIQPANSKIWCDAVQHLLCSSPDTHYLGGSFLLLCSLMLLEKMEEPVDCKQMAKQLLEMGVRCCSDPTITYPSQIVTVLFNINESPALNAKIGSPQELLSDEYKARLFLLFANHPDAQINQAGEGKFTSCIKEMDLSEALQSERNKTFFLWYAERPFISSPSSHALYLYWFEKSWLLFRCDLTWGAACNAVRAALHYPYVSEGKPFLLRMLNIWETLLLGRALKQWSGVSQTDQSLFSELPVLLMVRIKREGKSLAEQAHFLTLLRQKFNYYVPLFSVEAKSRFRLWFCIHALSLFPFEAPETIEAARLCFEDLTPCLSEMMTLGVSDTQLKTKERQTCILGFINALPHLFNIEGADLSPQIVAAIHQMMGISWIVNGTQAQEFCWYNVLQALTNTLRIIDSSKQHAVALIVRDLFIACTHPDRVQQRKKSVSPQMLLERSQVGLGFLFMARTYIHCLTHDEWRKLLHGIPLQHVMKMINGLTKIKYNGRSQLFNSMGAARLIRYSNSAEALIELCRGAVRSSIPVFSEELEIALQLECRAHWIMAMSDLAKRCKKVPDGFFEQKNALTTELTLLSISSISNNESCDFVSKTFKEIIDDDLAAAEAVFMVFDIPLDISSDLQSRLGELKNEIKATIHKLKK